MMTTLPRPEASPSLSILDKESDAVLVELKESIAGEPLDVILLTFEPGSPEDPQNWSRPYRWYLSLLSCFLVFVTTFASAAPSGYAADLRGQFHMTAELVALTITLFVIGFCFGPLLWGPLSEQFGRRAVLIPCYALFTVGAALSPNSASIMVFRLLGGIFSAAATPIAPALLADIWDPSTREKALTYLGFLSFVGPTLGPLVGGLMAGAHISWQWIFWLLTILSGISTSMVIITQRETYCPLLLARKAELHRKETRDPRYQAQFELVQKQTLVARLHATLAKPFVLFVREPALIAVTLYLGFIGGCLYMLFEAYPVVFEEGHHFPSSSLGLAYLPVTAGGVITMVIYLWAFQPYYERKVQQYAPEPIPPEERLLMAVWAAPLFSITFFWFGWTSFPGMNFWAPLMSGLLMGMSTLALIVSLLNYIIDVYVYAAASALGAGTVLRSIFGAIFPLFSAQMFRALNPRWASTLVGCIAVLMIPIPVLLMRYGPVLRAKSRYVA
ncbi:MFS general substrate transporter [Lentinus tigrinus ALCF2SS1-7]|uniref:MFS general substrate transporter n=1 Tax=Lentinus tigrinus ALCF2SS1-7 TaxID=1328758 RepID=UPI001166287E|nr:MFS general substrate transporter [Lentinus tigrinus ALCF2SS1-7]